MSFVSVPGLKGKVYVPDELREGSKKNPCQDCFSCQQCSDDRCRVCLSAKTCKCHDEVKYHGRPGSAEQWVLLW